MDRTLTFFHSPNTRASSTRILLEELGAPYTLHPVRMSQGENRRPEFLAINPLGKLPAIKDGDAVVTEQTAIAIYLADRFPDASLAPALDHPDRGPYLRWIAFYAAAFEPALIDHHLKRDPGGIAMSPYGSYDAVIDALEQQLARGPWLLGDRFTAADVLWGVGLGWTLMFKLVPPRPAFTAYVERFQARPAFAAAMREDKALAEAMAAPPT